MGTGCNCYPDCNLHTYDFQINTQALDVDELCSFDPDTHNPELDMALREWERTNSPLIHWYNSIVKNRTDYNIDEILSDKVNLIHGLPESEALQKCRDLFKRSMVKIAIEVDNTNSQEMILDVSTTFAEAIGVVGGPWASSPEPVSSASLSSSTGSTRQSSTPSARGRRGRGC